jgi:PAS domain S-box-containing protein
MFSEPTRREALELARDTGAVGVTHPVKLLQETSTAVQSGVLAYQAVYQKDAVLQTVEQRRAALVGWTYSPYRLTDLMEGIFRDDLHDIRIELFDEDSSGPEGLLYDSESAHARTAPTGISWSHHTDIDGHVWTIRVSALPGYPLAAGLSTPWWALVAMITIALLLLSMAVTWAGASDRAQQLAGQLTASLRESEDRYRSVVDNLDEVVFQADREGRWTFLNPAWATLTGTPIASAIGQPIVDAFHSGTRARVQAMIPELLAARRESFCEEVQLQGDGLNGKWVQLFARATVTEVGVVGLSGTLSDVSARKAAEVATNAAREAAESANRAKDQFLATMSHEIRTPMNGVMGMAQVLLGTGLSPDQRSLTTTIVDSTESLLVVINDILDYSKVESGHLRLERESLRVRDVVADVVRLLQAQAEARHIPLEARVADDIPTWILGDTVRLRQVLINLVGNALKFTTSGSVTVSLTRAEGLPLRLVFAVRDTGIGMSRDVVQRIFTPFEQAEASTTRRYGGTGLGLSISKRLVEMMGGQITVESVVGAGSTFTVTLPFEEGAPIAAPGPTSASVAIPVNQHALIVDDNATNQLVLSRLLQRLGVSSSIAADGAEGLAMLRRHHYDVVLMDMQMPVMDGDEATRRIRAGEAGAGTVAVPIIALTADAMEGTRARCLAAGMNDFVAKPVHLDSLQSCLGRWLSRPA